MKNEHTDVWTKDTGNEDRYHLTDDIRWHHWNCGGGGGGGEDGTDNAWTIPIITNDYFLSPLCLSEPLSKATTPRTAWLLIESNVDNHGAHCSLFESNVDNHGAHCSLFESNVGNHGVCANFSLFVSGVFAPLDFPLSTSMIYERKYVPRFSACAVRMQVGRVYWVNEWWYACEYVESVWVFKSLRFCAWMKLEPCRSESLIGFEATCLNSILFIGQPWLRRTCDASICRWSNRRIFWEIFTPVRPWNNEKTRCFWPGNSREWAKRRNELKIAENVPIVSKAASYIAGVV